MTYAEDGRTITGTDPKAAVILLDAMGADVIGANCSVGPEKLLEAAKQMVPYTNKPIIIQPNAACRCWKMGRPISHSRRKTLAAGRRNLPRPAYPSSAAAAARRRIISVKKSSPSAM